MCRWLAYAGPPIHPDSLIFRPQNSLISQSRQSLYGASPTNGDGFGLGWYDGQREPGLFRDSLPAWNDENLRSLSQHIRADLFFAHVRASTGTPTARSNCHPFRHGRWLFMHNGRIGGYERVCRDLAFLVAPEFYPRIQGATDSELFFYLLLTNGLEADPGAALSRSVGQVHQAMRAADMTEAILLTVAVSDGETIHALRYGSDGAAPSLYYGCGARPQDHEGVPVEEAGKSVLIVSEPLDHVEEQWTAVPPSHILVAGGAGIAVAPFVPASL